MAKWKTRKAKVPLTFAEKVRKDFPEFAAEIDALNIQEMEIRISKYQKGLQDSEETKARDEALIEAQAQAKLLGAPYRELRTDVKTKTRYLIESIRQKGGS